jgi:hypothetical protein
MPMLGYARVSTRDQDLAGQVAEGDTTRPARPLNP